jgi:hypothetical protein
MLDMITDKLSQLIAVESLKLCKQLLNSVQYVALGQRVLWVAIGSLNMREIGN